MFEISKKGFEKLKEKFHWSSFADITFDVSDFTTCLVVVVILLTGLKSITIKIYRENQK